MVSRRWLLTPLVLLMLAATAACSTGDDGGAKSTEETVLTEGTELAEETESVGAILYFQPESLAVGGVLRITGHNWDDDSVTIFLIPRDEERTEAQFKADGEYIRLGDAVVSSAGGFSAEFTIEAEYQRENQSTHATAPAEYLVAARDRDELYASGYLRIEPE